MLNYYSEKYKIKFLCIKLVFYFCCILNIDPNMKDLFENIVFNYYSIEFYVFSVFSIALFVQLLFFLIVFIKIWFKPKEKQKAKKEEPVTVIICARNEAENLKKNLPLVLEQEYNNFQVVVVNDSSTDDSESILADFDDKYDNLYVTKIAKDQKFNHGKKLAITVGIKAAKHEWLLFTDADCKPASKKWISAMASNFSKDTDIVLGYGAYERKKGFLNQLIRFDNLMIAIQYFSFAMARMPYMGVGRNLAYRKSLFFKSKGFASHFYIISGDDDLFVNKNANRKNTKIELSHDSFTVSETFDKFKYWNRQKQRHFTASAMYKLKHKFFLALEPFTRMLLYVSLIYLAINKQFLILIIPLFLIKIILFYITILKASKRFNESGLIFLSLFFDFFLPLLNFINQIKGNFRRNKMSWN